MQNLRKFTLGTRQSKPNTTRAQPNGCGTEMLAPLLDLIFDKKHIKCCNAHDLCYSNCTMEKHVCDSKMKECFSRIRGDIAAEFAYAVLRGTRIACAAYLNSQNEFCNCI
ncbi:group XIIA secretory phospholipase A2-like isoform X2 [Dinothrombium tinctorium]|uniref:Group XIIA secretory phospholipase A2-like isoform X2 n=1 Tax=Dinothrombium tinctorium TaxID=1965070 RepID=A0A3S3QB23_9ACAR|nr:group XIIA secretory phospholipase A2-like isoform X2 [Dinothrombium tinctorium]RWS06548.1 group XIIA secretory phospholipase A2-like isoform X2 [Dinothrombium tinctorium]RWS09994.1 group XIIA secretory phospholipase A2-like isoform X2 [Dinothrombium tinctorium]